MYKYLFVFLMTLIPAIAQAQIVNTDLIDSQSELDYLLESGQIDPEQYRILDEFFSVYFNQESPELNSLASEIENQIVVDSQPDFVSGESLETSNKKYFQTAVTYKIYQKFADNFSYRQLFSIRGAVGTDLQYLLVTEKKDHAGDFFFRERWFRFEQNKYTLEAGNYYPDWGLGVTAGYHSDFLDKSGNPMYQSILYPYLSRYNGLRLEYNARLNPIVMLSYDRTSNLRGRLLAIGLNYNLTYFEFGLLCNYHNLDNLNSGNNFSQLLIGGYFQWNKNDYEIEAEISESKLKNWAGIITFQKKQEWGQFILQGWNYPSGYRNPYGGGKANSDYRTVDLEDTDISYRSRQNGEYGFLSRTDYKFNSYHKFSVTANYWQDAGQEKKFRIRFSDHFSLAKTWKSKVTLLYGDDNLNEGYGYRQHLRIDLMHSKRGSSNFRISAEFKRVFYSYGRRDYLRAEMKFSRRFSERVSASIKISRLDSDLLDGQPGYWFIYLEESIRFGKYARIRVVLDSKESKRYNLINSARINLQITMAAY